MKFSLVALFAFSVCLFGLIQALPNERYKRALGLFKCPDDVPCENYVQQLKKENKNCVDYNYNNGATYSVASCPPLPCQKAGKQDLSKPYPDCCAKCE